MWDIFLCSADQMCQLNDRAGNSENLLKVYQLNGQCICATVYCPFSEWYHTHFKEIIAIMGPDRFEANSFRRGCGFIKLVTRLLD